MKPKYKIVANTKFLILDVKQKFKTVSSSSLCPRSFRTRSKNMLLLKNLQFLPDHNETLTKEGTHEDLILTKFRIDPVNFRFLTESGNSWDTV